MESPQNEAQYKAVERELLSDDMLSYDFRGHLDKAAFTLIKLIEMSKMCRATKSSHNTKNDGLTMRIHYLHPHMVTRFAAKNDRFSTVNYGANGKVAFHNAPTSAILLMLFEEGVTVDFTDGKRHDWIVRIPNQRHNVEKFAEQFADLGHCLHTRGDDYRIRVYVGEELILDVNILSNQ